MAMPKTKEKKIFECFHRHDSPGFKTVTHLALTPAWQEVWLHKQELLQHVGMLISSKSQASQFGLPMTVLTKFKFVLILVGRNTSFWQSGLSEHIHILTWHDSQGCATTASTSRSEPLSHYKEPRGRNTWLCSHQNCSKSCMNYIQATTWVHLKS